MRIPLHRRAGATLLLAAVAHCGVTASAERAEAKSLDSLDPKLKAEVSEKGRAYFEDQNDRWRGRKELKAAFEKATSAGTNPLQDLELLRDVLYQARGFSDDFANREWQKLNDVDFAKSGPYNTVTSERMRFTYMLPTAYPAHAVLKAKPEKLRPKPLPLLFVFHESQDDKQGGRAGEEVLKRRWPKDDFPSVYQGWMMLAPTAPRGNFVLDDGTTRQDLTREVFSVFWKSYHVDFDRVVLDGSDAALAMAAATPVFFSGLILRGGKVDPAVVRNYASLPVYVTGDAKLKEQLEAAGHKNVTAGQPAGLADWLAKLPAKTRPTEFAWTMAKSDQGLAHWVSIETADPTASERSLAVKVDREKGQIRIDAKGVDEIAVFLNDQIVDLDKEVEVVVNGHVERKQKLERSFDQLLDKEPISIRKSLYLGWLFPAMLPKISVRPPEDGAPANGGAKPAEGATTPPTAPAGAADAATEDKAQKYWTKASDAETAGDLATAKDLYTKLVALGNTTLKEKAEAKLKELNGRSSGAAEKPQ
jgi:hypothetical protein